MIINSNQYILFCVKSSLAPFLMSYVKLKEGLYALVKILTSEYLPDICE